MENIKIEEQRIKDLICKLWSIGFQEYNKSNHSAEIGTDLNYNSENLSYKENNFRLDNENDSSNDLQGGINRIEKQVNQLFELKDTLISSIEKQFKDICDKLDQNMRDEPQNDLIEKDKEIRELKKRIEEMEKMENEYRNKVDGIEPIIEINEKYKYNELSSEIRDYIEKLCGSSDVLALISLGRDEKILEQLWQYLKEKAILNNPDVKPDVKFLNDYFEFCIAVYNSTYNSSGKFEIHEINLNDDFDLNYCIKTQDSRQIGNVVDIITHCYKKNGNVIFKGVVKVGS